MATDSDTLKAILREMENISFLMGDVNAIRNGECELPRGADPAKHPHSKARTFDDVLDFLEHLHAESQRQTALLEEISDALTADSGSADDVAKS